MTSFTAINLLIGWFAGEKDLSIISPVSGTTRDVVETSIDYAGYSVTIADTAGIKDLHDPNIDLVEREGIKRAIQRYLQRLTLHKLPNGSLLLYRVRDCHILILVIDSVKYLHSRETPIPDYIQELIRDRVAQDLLIVLNKIDLVNPQDIRPANILDGTHEANCLSCLSEEGFDRFSDRLTKMIENFCGDPQAEVLFSNDRHIVHLQELLLHLHKVDHFIHVDLAIAASHLRQASYQLGCLTGSITTEDVLDVLFQDFCIGK